MRIQQISQKYLYIFEELKDIKLAFIYHALVNARGDYEQDLFKAGCKKNTERTQMPMRTQAT